jgi:transmembrane sensor
MRPEEVSKIRRELEPPWNDLREQRVLGRIQEARRRARRRPAQIAGGAAVLAAAAVVALIAVRWGHVSSPATGAPSSPVASASAPTSPSPGPEHEQRLALADGSQAFLVRDARVRVDEQRADLVHIAQERGEVRYEVRPDRSREFVVVAPGASVRVRGTIFSVDVEGDHVEVRVERGKVEVDDGARLRELVAGESLRLATRDGARDGDSGPALVESPPREPVAPPLARPSFVDLMAQADAARAAGHQDEAARALERLLAAYPQDPRVSNALFTLGKVERARHDARASARAFERCLRAAPNGPLAQEALAEAASSLAAAGDAEAARRDAQRYLDRWPAGLQATQMRAILER